jgi:RimJ/RimL family protein N-acetyltransferase
MTAIAELQGAPLAGPFRALLSEHTDALGMNFAMPVRPLPPREQTLAAVGGLRTLFQDRGRRLRFEYNEGLWPDLEPILREAGLQLEVREPLMAVTPETRRPAEAQEVSVRRLGPDQDEADLAAFLTIRSQAANPPPAEVARLREALRAGRGRYALASLGGVPAGTAVMHVIDGVGEVVGVVTVPELRGRGVAAAAAGFLVEGLFAEGGRMAWLDAIDERAQRVYQRIGFFSIGWRLNFLDPATPPI